MSETRAQANRRIRQEALREQLSKQKHVEQVIETLEKLNDLDDELDSVQVQRLAKVIDARFKLINKYLPDIKEVFSEVTGENGGPLQVQVNVRD